MSIVEEFQVRTLSVYETTMGNLSDTFNVDPRDDTIEKGPRPIEELSKLQVGPKPGKCTQLRKDLTIHEHRYHGIRTI